MPVSRLLSAQNLGGSPCQHRTLVAVLVSTEPWWLSLSAQNLGGCPCQHRTLVVLLVSTEPWWLSLSAHNLSGSPWQHRNLVALLVSTEPWWLSLSAHNLAGYPCQPWRLARLHNLIHVHVLVDSYHLETIYYPFSSCCDRKRRLCIITGKWLLQWLLHFQGLYMWVSWWLQIVRRQPCGVYSIHYHVAFVPCMYKGETGITGLVWARWWLSRGKSSASHT